MDILQPTLAPVYDKEIKKQLTNEFKRIKGECYVDHAGATLHSDSQMEKIYQDLSSTVYPNPHSGGGSGNLTQEIIERTRYRILDFFNASSDEYSLAFTSGTTASLKCIAETFQFRDSNQSNGNFVYLQDNHTSVLGMRDLVAQRDAEVKCLTCDNAFDIFSQDSGILENDSETTDNNSLFVYSAQCNFSGFKYPLEWIDQIHKGALNKLTNKKSNWFVLLDAACFVGTNQLDLSKYKFDFVVMSFYKMFGYPTGIGALIVKNTSIQVLDKVYYGGGTVNMALSLKNCHIKRENFHERFEDGTVPFLSIISLQHGLDALSAIPMDKISSHVFSLAQYFHHSLLTMHHHNGNPVVKLYTDSDYQDREIQGGMLAFNLLRSNGEYVGYMEVVHMAALFKIHLRTGCFCNPGACQRHLNLSNEDVVNNYDSGVKCGGGVDLINGKPTGAVRISFGYMSTLEDVQTIILMVRKCFLDAPEMKKIPRWYEKQVIWNNKYRKSNFGRIDNIKEIKEDIKKDRKNFDEFKNSNKNGKEKYVTLSKIFIYPIKSCGAFEVKNSWILTSTGLQYDREWMIITSAGICLTQKQEIMLCLLKPTVCLQDHVMKLDYPGMPTIEVPLDYRPKDRINGEMCRSRVCGHRVEGVDCGIEVSEWLSLALGRPNLKLIRQHNFDEFLIKSKPDLSFSSQAQYLLINKASIQWLVDKIGEDSDCDKNTVLDRFRGNLVVEGGLPFEEDSWTQIKVGKEYFEVNGPCTRCQMVCIDQNTGIKTIEPLRLLAEEFRGKMKFGIYLSRKINDLSRISVGDSVLVTCSNVIAN